MTDIAIDTISTAAGPLAYRESGGSGPAVIFIHGNSSSGATWKGQLSGSIGSAYRCIAVDLPGHGDSAPYGSIDDHSMPGYAATIRTLVDELGLSDVALVGWSLGGHIALEALTVIDAVRGVCIFGTPPMGKPPAMEEAFLPNPAMNLGFTPDLSPDDAATFAQAFLAPGSTVPVDDFVADILKTSGSARLGLGASVAAANYADEVEIVSTMAAPLAIVQGVDEQLVATDFLQRVIAPTLWRGSVQLIDGAGHAPHHETPAAFDDVVLSFLDSLSAYPRGRTRQVVNGARFQ